ncbi:HK97 family phage prohead protease [Erythrobacter sp. sf7]|uniref:HK97 family phage prohead protease n=1 Tax=Erythrobacter fulvus TaxID=2987523 RepID=A0ABT5JSU5_9SPHN|nr:HK97 family phage prohead protease [Erythrobacter fulvus]MDC8755843.1 HK97 family phage prohead protease [Erythrobacter fulvus]
MDSPVFSAGLELREAGDGSRRLRGRFPYGTLAVIDAGGNGRRPRKERFASRAFRFAVDDPDREIHLLIGHSFDRPLASRKAGTLTFTDSEDALTFEAILTREIQRTTWGQDFLAAYAAGLITGLSPGFRVAPPEAVPRPEETTDEDPRDGNALIRTIFAAILFEFSLVTRPAYPETEADLRAFNPAPAAQHPMAEIMRRWRL